METYGEYKESGLEWVNKIPTKWDVVRFKTICTLGKGLSITKADLVEQGIPVVSYGQIHSKTNTGVHISEELIRYVEADYLDGNENALVNYGDIIFADTSEDYEGIGNCVFVDTYNEIFAGYHTIVARPQNIRVPKYYAYLFQDDKWRKQVRSRVMGIKVFSLTQKILKDVTVLVPSDREQEEIAKYLDYHISRIELLIEDLGKQAAMMEIYMRELIANCITKGLNKTAPMKDSGVDWMGEVPEHWNVTKMKWMFEIVKRIYGAEDRDVLSITQRGIKVKDIDSNDGQLAESYANYQVVNVNDFAMNSMDLLTGWVDCSPYEGVTSPDYRVFRFHPDKPQCHTYYKYLFQMCYTNRIFYRLGQGVSNLGRWRLQAEQFLNIRLPQPPIEEQEQIAAYLDTRVGQIEELTADIKAQIEKLKEYRKIVIHDAVTGKIKVTEGE